MQFPPKCRLGFVVALAPLLTGFVTPAAAFEHDEFSDRDAQAILTTHWAFRLPTSQQPPAVPASLDRETATAWSHARIDRFVAHRIATAGLTPSAEAAPQHLIRRLFFDLTGLPPSAEEVDAFCRDPSDEAYEALVDKLLTSREHAEHWARKWLDVARYADTVGYAIDGQASTYPFAWTYRDWVVKALHEDLPYDRFVTLQLAADLVDPPVPPADLAALGFLTVGRTFTGNQHDIIDDRIDLVTRGLMGLSVACARCHDHKYELVTMADYYALHGIFASCEVPDELPVIGPPPRGPAADAFASTMAKLEARVADHERSVHARATREAIAHAADYLLETARPLPRPDGRPPRLADGYELEQLLIDRLLRTLDKATADHPVLGPWVMARDLPDRAFAAWTKSVGKNLAATTTLSMNKLIRDEVVAKQPPTLQALAGAYGTLIQRAHAAAGTPADSPELAAIRETFAVPGAPMVVLPHEAMRVATRKETTEYRKRKRAVIDHQATVPGGPPRAMVLRDIPQVRDSRILHHGHPGQPGDVVPRRLPTVLGGTAVDRTTSGRLDLARAIASPTNPLVARLIVDWTWRHHFGRGLLETPGDLGLRGDPPSHPELLDDLASRFVEEGRWSLRWLHREIVLSRAWRQSSEIRKDLVAADPDNKLFARAHRRRLDWEPWRDSLLAVAGTLDLSHPGGPGIDPLATTSLHARSLYARLDRQDVPGIMRTFDIANPDTAVHARTRTTVPQQGLAALNAPLVVEAARRLAARIAMSDDDAFVRALWRQALSRDPSAEEVRLATEWLADDPQGGGVRPTHLGPRNQLAQAILASAEFEFLD
jgi:hypothetical protein